MAGTTSPDAAGAAAERGLVLAAMLLGPDDVCDRLAGLSARPCADAVATLQALSRPERARRLAALIAELRRPQTDWLAALRAV